jgi:protoheme ferro-lyase
LSSACSTAQDETNFKKYMNQDLTIKGKVGVLITALGQSEQYDFAWINTYMTMIFNVAIPPILKPFILRNSGTVLRDPDNLEAAKEFKPKTLIDCHGKTKNSNGVPYANLEVDWVDPRKEGDAGHFFLDEENDYIDMIEKIGIKMLVADYNKLPNKTIPYRRQHQAIFKDVKALLSKEYPDMPVEIAWAMYPKTVNKAIDKLLTEKVETIVVVDSFPTYSNLEEFNSLFPEIEHHVASRAKVIFAPFAGASPSLRKAYVLMAQDEFAALPKEDKKLLLLVRHGIPVFEGEPYPKLGKVYYHNLKKDIEVALAGSNTEVLLADIDFAGEEYDEDDKKLAGSEAIEQAQGKGYKHIVILLAEFLTENTDSVFCAREEVLEPLHFEYKGQVPYNDYTMRYRTVLKKNETTYTIAGTPVDPKYRVHVSQAFHDAITTVLDGKKWPNLLID